MKRFLCLLLGLLSLTGAPSTLLAQQTGYKQTSLVANLSGVAAQTDTQLLNPWGTAFIAGAPFWIANNSGGTSTLYDQLGNKQVLAVGIPSASLNPCGPGCPTGVVANNNSADFGGAGSFIFDTEDGIVAKWTGRNSAVTIVDNSPANAVYKGLALVSNGSGDFLLAPTFAPARSMFLTGTLIPRRCLVRSPIQVFPWGLLRMACKG